MRLPQRLVKPAAVEQPLRQTTHSRSAWSENGAKIINACHHQISQISEKLVSQLISASHLMSKSQNYTLVSGKNLNRQRLIGIASMVALLITCAGSCSTPAQAINKSASPASQPAWSVQQRLHFATQRQRLPAVMRELQNRIHRTSYVFSGSTPRGWDCSGMTSWAYQQLGVEIPHSADKQAHLGQRVHDPIMGDLVVFAHTGSTDFYHVGIYLAHGQILNANSYYHTTIRQSLRDYADDQIRFVRLIPDLH